MRPNIDPNELMKLFQIYLDEAKDQLESDDFLPGLDVTYTAARELFGDVVLTLTNLG